MIAGAVDEPQDGGSQAQARQRAVLCSRWRQGRYAMGCRHEAVDEEAVEGK